jgi:hypothetical protein
LYLCGRNRRVTPLVRLLWLHPTAPYTSSWQAQLTAETPSRPATNGSRPL